MTIREAFRATGADSTRDGIGGSWREVHHARLAALLDLTAGNLHLKASKPNERYHEQIFSCRRTSACLCGPRVGCVGQDANQNEARSRIINCGWSMDLS